MLTIILTVVVILIISITINILLYKALLNQLKKINLYEKLVDEYEIWIDDVRESIRSTYLKLKNVDDRNLFISDDDVGFVFKDLLDLLKKLNDRIQK